MILQRANHFQSGPVADVCEARIFVAAKISLQNPPVLCPVENCAPGFKLPHPIRRFLRVQLRHPPLVYILSAAHCVGEVNLPIVAFIDIGKRRGNPAFRHDGMGFS